MMLKALERKHVDDDKLWELVDQVNNLTQGDYDDWDHNAEAIVPMMEQILLRAKEVEDWQVYFYDMSKLIWFVRRDKVKRLRVAFQIAEMFHQDYQKRIGEYVSQFGRDFRVNVAVTILKFYISYPQIDDAKIEQMKDIFKDCEARYGSRWNNGGYTTIMLLALINKDKALAKEAAERLEHVEFENWCYVCTYIWPMMGYYLFLDDFEAARLLILRIRKRGFPRKYHWCYEKCQMAEEKKGVNRALTYCMQLGRKDYFVRFWEEWEGLYQDPQEREVDDTHEELFHAMAGEWTHRKKQLMLVQQDDKDRQEQAQTPLDCLHWDLCWSCYFLLLERSGVSSVQLELGCDEDTKCNGEREWTCKEAAAYFEQQADIVGAQMDRARKKFGYAQIKQCYLECLLE